MKKDFPRTMVGGVFNAHDQAPNGFDIVIPALPLIISLKNITVTRGLLPTCLKFSWSQASIV